MGEFRSRLEEVVEVRELDFEQPEAFGRYKVFFPEEAVRHPAKAYTDVLEWLVKRYTKPGDVVLDPMAGTGSSGVVAALHGRHAILVDIEERFVEWMRKAKELVEKHQTLTPKGKVTVIHGDARRLSQLLGEHVNTVITSPPYADSKKGGVADADKMADRWERHRSDAWNTWGSSAHTPGRLRAFESLGSGYSDNPNNIGNLSYGDIDAIIMRIGCSTIGRTIENPNAIDNVKSYGDIDAIITSPPYEKSHPADRDAVRRFRKGGRIIDEYVREFDKDNISNLKGETYLEAMLKVYGECYKVLRPGGKMAIIVKPFIRNKQVVDLPWHTHLLMTKVGFKPHEFFKYRLKHMSFWRTLYFKRHPEVPRITHEYIMVYEKPIGD